MAHHQPSDSTRQQLNYAQLGHEIKNIVQSLRANLQTTALIWNKTSNTTTPAKEIDAVRDEMPEILNEMQSALDHITQIANDVKMTPTEINHEELEETELREIIDGAIRRTRAQAPHLAIGIDRDSYFPTIRAIPHRLTQVFINLLLNSAAAAGSQPPRVRIKCWCAEDQAIIEVSDNGIGIDPEILLNPFKPCASTRLKTGGSGLGLYICRQIVNQHKGEIRAENRPGDGAVFTVRLPVK